MPLYQYWCDKCLNAHEITMKLSDLEEVIDKEKDIECPLCGSNLRMLICPPKIVRIN